MGIYAQLRKERRSIVETTQSRSNYSYRADRRAGTRARRSGNELVSYTVMSLVLILSSLTMPLASTGSTLTRAVAWSVCLVCAALTVFTSRSFISVVLVSLSFTFVISYAGDPTGIAIIFGAILSCGLYAAAVAAARRIHLFFLVSAPVISVTLAYLLTSSVTLSLLTVIHLIPALAMGLAARRSLDRSRSIALFAAISVVELLLAVAAYIYSQNGTLSADVIEYAVEYLRGGIEWTLRDAITRAGAVQIDENILLMIRQMSSQLINLLPGLLAIAALTLGFFVQKIEHSLFESYEKEELLEASSAPINASLAAALIFVAAHVLSYTSSSTHAPSFFAIASENLSLVLLPALLAVGFRVMTELPRKIGFLALVAWIGAVLFANLLSMSILTVLALVGAFYIIFVRTDAWAKDHYAKGEDQ